MRHALRELNLNRLTRADFATPPDAVNVALTRGSGWCDQFPCKLIKRHIRQQGVVKPGADLLTTAGDKSRAAVVIPQQIIEECQPVVGVGDPIVEQPPDDLLSFVCCRVCQKRGKRFWIR